MNPSPFFQYGPDISGPAHRVERRYVAFSIHGDHLRACTREAVIAATDSRDLEGENGEKVRTECDEQVFLLLRKESPDLDEFVFLGEVPLGFIAEAEMASIPRAKLSDGTLELIKRVHISMDANFSDMLSEFKKQNSLIVEKVREVTEKSRSSWLGAEKALLHQKWLIRLLVFGWPVCFAGGFFIGVMLPLIRGH